MKVAYTKEFHRDIKRLKDKALSRSILKIANRAGHALTLKELPAIKKLKGHKRAFRIRVGNYRIGFFLVEDTILFAAIAHRKDIYKRFP